MSDSILNRSEFARAQYIDAEEVWNDDTQDVLDAVWDTFINDNLDLALVSVKVMKETFSDNPKLLTPLEKYPEDLYINLART